MNHALLASDFSSATSSPPSAFRELEQVRALLQIRLWLKGMLWLIWSVQTTRTFSMSATRLFCFLIVCCVFTGIAHLIYFNNSSFCIYIVANWQKRLRTCLSWLLTDLPHSALSFLALIKVRVVQLFLSLEYLGAIVRYPLA